jgi:iron(III) transport system permease protein
VKPSWIFALTALSLFFIIALLPIGYMLIGPFWGEQPETTTDHEGLFEARHLPLARNSLLLGMGTSALSLLLGIPLGFCILRTDLWSRRILGSLYILPILIPPHIHAIVWTHLDPFLRESLSLKIHGIGGAIFILTLAYFPFVTLLTISGLQSVDRNAEEAALIAYGPWQTLRSITLPMIAPHILSGALLVFIFAVVDFGVPDILRVNVFPVEIFVQFSAFYDERAAALLSIPLVGLTLFLIALLKWATKDAYIQVLGGASKGPRFVLGRLRIPALGACVVLMALSSVLPLAVLAKMAGPISTYVRALKSSLVPIGYSLILAASGAMAALVLAFFLSYVNERMGFRCRRIMELVYALPLAIPATTLGIGLIKLWNRPPMDVVYGSSLMIIIGYTARFVAFSIISITSGFKQIDPRLEEAAHLDIPSKWRIMGRIVVPLLRPSCVSAFFIVFVLSLGELGTTLLIVPPGIETVPIKIYNLMHYGANDMVAALSLVLVAVIFAFSGLFLLWHKKAGNGRIGRGEL